MGPGGRWHNRHNRIGLPEENSYLVRYILVDTPSLPEYPEGSVGGNLPAWILRFISLSF